MNYQKKLVNWEIKIALMDPKTNKFAEAEICLLLQQFVISNKAD